MDDLFHFWRDCCKNVVRLFGTGELFDTFSSSSSSNTQIEYTSRDIQGNDETSINSSGSNSNSNNIPAM